MSKGTLRGQVFEHVAKGGLYVVLSDEGVWEPDQLPIVTYKSLTDLNLPIQHRHKHLFLDGRFKPYELLLTNAQWNALQNALEK